MDKSWIVIQYDNRVINSDELKLVDLNKKYCAKHGYTHILETKPYDLPPYWIKVKIVKEMLNTNKYKGVLWVDTDATIHNQDLSIDSLLVNNKSMYCSPDPPHWGGEFNAGVWFVKNDIHGNEIIEKWMSYYNAKDWTKNINKWQSSGPWAGDTYEQGAFIKHIKPEFEKYIHVYPWQVFQSYEPSSTTFSMHFAADLSDKYLPTYLNTIYYKNLFINIIICLCILISTVLLCIFRPKFFQSIKLCFYTKI